MKNKTLNYSFILLLAFCTVPFSANSTKNALVLTETATAIGKPNHPYLTENTKTISFNSADPDYYSDGMLKVKNGDTQKFGYFDVNGKKIFNTEWSSNYALDNRFDGGVATAMKDMKYYILHKDGTALLIPPTYTNISDFCDGLALATKIMGGNLKNKLVYLNAQGKEVLPLLAQTIPSFTILPDKPRNLCEGLRAHMDITKKLWGFVDQTGKQVIPAAYSKVEDFSDGMAAVLVTNPNGTGEDKWGFIDKSGKMVISPKFSEKPLWFANGFAPVQKKDGSFTFINKAGEISSPDFLSANSFFGGYAIVVTKEGNGVRPRYACVLDTTFKEVAKTDYIDIPYSYENAGFHFNKDSVAAVHEDGGGSWPIKNDGKILFKGNYNEFMYDFHDGLALCRVNIDSKHYVGFMNYKGEMVFIFKDEEF